MNSTQLAQAIEAEQDKINELEAELSETERHLHQLKEQQRIAKAAAEAKQFFSEHFTIISVK
jgi:cell division protein FtsB